MASSSCHRTQPRDLVFSGRDYLGSLSRFIQYSKGPEKVIADSRIFHNSSEPLTRLPSFVVLQVSADMKQLTSKRRAEAQQIVLRRCRFETHRHASRKLQSGTGGSPILPANIREVRA